MKKHIPLLIIIAGLAILLPSLLFEKEPPLPEIPKDLKGLIIDSPARQLPEFSLIFDISQKSYYNSISNI